ncbi:MAG: system potassium uptake protein [Thermoleophilaceae bacterium]|jgi:KUP system potassium uptake protein|nr:system potassium uptake protein [Thermoleophilaceae bacterium]
MSAHGSGSPGRRALIIGALGVVFGDIGTSPIYTVQTVFNPGDPHPVAAATENIFGVISLIFWSVMIIVTVTYVLLVLRADNDGEGGIMALITLIRKRQAPGGKRTKLALAALGIFGASLFLGDSMITPAISVLSAIEGVKVAEPSLAHLVIPATLVIIVGLFSFQRRGTAEVGRLFGPIMILWFLAIGTLGAVGIARHPEILGALSPTHAIAFFFGHFEIAFFALAAVVLAITGAEALYADLGHFGRSPITRAWLFLVFPACILSYMGQGALLLDNPTDNLSSPFFLLAPEWARWPLVLLATAATVIASQAVITGAFSVTRQAVQLGYLPRLRIRHTSAHSVGQIYVPGVNWLLMVSVIVLVLTFQSSAALAFAFGMAVTGTITITTTLFLYYARQQWRKPLWIVLAGGGALLTIDLFFLAANLTKLSHGAWLPLLIGITAFTVLTTWQRGRHMVTAKRREDEGSLDHFIDNLHQHEVEVRRVPGTAVFLTPSKVTAPLAMAASVRHLHALHEHVVILSIETQPVPHIGAEERLVIDDLGNQHDGITYVGAHFGYMDQPDVPSVLRLLEKADIECPLEVDEASYFLSTIELVRGDMPGMSRWRKGLFLATARISADPAEYFCLPRDQTLVIGSRIEV